MTMASGCASSASGDARKETFEFFWKKDSPFSQWHPSKFEVDGHLYVTAEQYMMHQKAVLFKDDEIAEQILATKDPRKQKSLGRKVRNYDDDVWNKCCYEVVKKGNKCKFSQNAKLKEALVLTHPRTLVEASPVDAKWGCGHAADDPRALRREQWRGENLLGQALTEVRAEIMAEENL